MKLEDFKSKWHFCLFANAIFSVFEKSKNYCFIKEIVFVLLPIVLCKHEN